MSSAPSYADASPSAAYDRDRMDSGDRNGSFHARRNPSASSFSSSSPPRHGHHLAHARPLRRVPALGPAPPHRPPTSIPLDENFDALSTEVPTEWQPGDGHPDYDQSVSGYQNYVKEMERMLSGQMDPPTRRADSRSPDSPRRLHVDTRRALGHGTPTSPTAAPPPNNARQVSGKRGHIELVESHVMEDGPTRTISLWRERVAASSVGGDSEGEREREGRTEVDSHAHRHRRVPSVSTEVSRSLRRVVSDNARAAVESPTKRAMQKGGAYERSEYMVSYRETLPRMFTPQADSTHPLLDEARDLRTPSSPTTSKLFPKGPPSPTLRRRARHSIERSEQMVTYPNTPPRSNSPANSTVYLHKAMIQAAVPMKALDPHSVVNMPVPAPYYPPQSIPTESSVSRTLSPAKASGTPATVDAILVSCEPSLLHIAPALDELGIKRVDHLRAVARLSEETRDREIKDQLLKRGVTVVEWAIFLDRLQML